MIDIKDIQGNILLSTCINEGSKGKFMLQKEDYIILKFSVYEPVYFRLGDGIDNEIGLFELIDVENCKPTYNENNGGYDYELRLDAYYWKWKNKIFKYTPEYGGQEASWNLTATLDVHLGIFLRNLTNLGYKFRGTAFQFSIDSTVENSAKLVSYDSTNMIDALTAMAEAWECEWWVTDNIIHFGRCEFGDPVDFEIDVNVKSMPRSSSKTDYATRIIAFGSDRNIPTNYRPVDEQIVVNGVVQRRLMLPAGTPYVDAYEGMSQEEAVEDIVVFDDIYPRMTSTVTAVELSTGNYVDENNKPTGETYPIYTITTDIKNFSKEFLLDDLKLKFESGLLNGYSFKLNLKSSDENSTVLEITRSNEESGERDLPDETLKPAVGDTFVLFGYDTSYINENMLPAAEQELEERTEAYVAKTKIDPSTYDCKMSSDYMYNNGTPRTFAVGDKVNLINKGYFENGRVSRIIGFEYNLDKPYDSPVYTVGETVAYSRLGNIEDKVDAITYKGQSYTGGSGSGVYVIRLNDNTSPSDSNVFSAKRSKAMFLRKDVSDTAAEVIKFLKGIISKGNIDLGDFIGGLAGQGARLQPNGNIEARNLTLWESLIVPVLTYNKTRVIAGHTWLTEGGGIIDSVILNEDGISGTMKLRFDEDEKGTVIDGIGKVDVDDLCMGIWHDIDNAVNNDLESSDDGIGNYTFKGFGTSYFRITEIIDTQNNTEFSFVMRPTSPNYSKQILPKPGMHFAQFGNPTNTDRQKAWYITTSYIRQLTGVTDWEYTKANVAIQFGDLTNLSVFGLNMSDKSAYLNNIWMSGTIEQLENLPAVLNISTDGDNFIAAGEILHLTCNVTRGFTDITSQVTNWTIERESGDQPNDDVWNIDHLNFNGEIDLTYDDLGSNSYTTVSTLFRIKANNENVTLASAILTI